MRDNQTLLSAAQAVTATAFSTDSYDQQGARNAGAGEPVAFRVRTVQAFNNLTSLDVQIVTSVNSDLSSPTVLQTINVLLAGLTATTYIWQGYLPVVRASQYLGFRYVVNGTAPSTGTIDATLARMEIPASFTNAVA